MAEINIRREHSLGLAKARKMAWTWAEQVEAKLQMECTVIEGQTSDTVEFTRTGVSGRLIVAADHFDLEAKLGFLLGAFSKTIETEIMKNLDGMLAAAGGAGKPAVAVKPAAAKAAPKKADAAKKSSRK